ncbi:MAG TPA: right-handed parallel beta-helix repeat-containing protein [Mucilaginibacter sp.]|nr:right-handed parallel beta-helix repeat-containing protein [Mucilaginibacter sp.]
MTTARSVFLLCNMVCFVLHGISQGSIRPDYKSHHNWYVSLSGNDNNIGTRAKPFKSIEKINGLTLAAGDTVFFKGGETFKGSLELPPGLSGSKERPIVITAYGRDNAMIDSKDSSAIRIYKNNYIKFEQLSLRGWGRKNGNVKDGLAIINCKDINVTNIDISGFQKSGLLIYSSQNIIAKNVFAHDNGSAGITVEAPYQSRQSRDIKILNCRAENNPGDPTNLTNQSGNGIVVGDCRQVLIDHCTATNNGWDMPRIGNGPVGIWAYEADSVIIQHCLSYKNKTSKGGADGGGFDLDGGVTNSIVQYNVSYDNWGSGYCIFQYWGASPWHDNIFRYNISENDGTVSDSQAGLYIWNSSDDEKQFHDCQVYGNIIYNDKVAALCYSEKSESKGIAFRYNVFVGKDSLIKGKDKIGDAKYYGNDWWSIDEGFKINGIKNLGEWQQKCVSEWGHTNVTILEANIRPDFKDAGHTTITSADELKNFDGYRLSMNSAFKNSMNYKFGIVNIKL